MDRISHPHSLIEAELEKLHRLARRMDALFRIPGTRIDVGLDNILGLVPLVGDALAAAPSIYIIHKSYRLGATPGALAYMVMNTTLDWLVGTVPIIGDILDVFYNANIRNVALLEKNLEKQSLRAREIHHRALPKNSGFTS